MRFPLCVGLILAVAGCTHARYAANADSEVHRLLGDYDAQVLADRETWVKYPAPNADESDVQDPDAVQAEDAPPASPAPLLLDLSQSLQLAFTNGREYLARKESLYRQGLSFSLTRHNFGPILNSTISYLWSKAEDGLASDSQTIDFGVTQILPTGGRLTVSSALDGARDGDPHFMEPYGRFLYTPSVSISLAQPLLRGAGYDVSHEALTQAERDVVYAVRSFELFRQDFSIRVADTYYRLVSQQATLANDEQNYKDAVFDRKKAEALRQVDRNQDDDVFLARRREIEAEDALLVARTDFELAVDDFKILLGLTTSTDMQIMEAQPPFEPVRFDPQSAAEVARFNRLDLHTVRDQLADAERQVRLAGHNLLPDLDLAADLDFAGDTARLSEVSPDRWSATVGVTLDLPLDRKAERNAYRSSLISLEQAKRDLQQRLDELERDIRRQIRELAQLEKRVRLQTEQIDREKRAVAVTRIRYESGDADNRDLLDARQGLVNAQNALIDLKVRHFTASLRLNRDMGVLFVDQNGMW